MQKVSYCLKLRFLSRAWCLVLGRNLWAATIFFCVVTASAQKQEAITVYIQQFESGTLPAKTQTVFDSLLLSPINRRSANKKFSGIHIQPNLNYESSPKEYHGHYAILVLTPLKFLEFKKALKEKLVPILVVQDNDDERGYYSPIFIINKNSTINSLNDDQIRNLELYLVDEKSASGYLWPLFQLWISGVIDGPRLEDAKAKFKNVELLGSHPAVREKVTKNVSAIGANWKIDSRDPYLQVFLRYGLLPQDAIAISSNLIEFKQEIIDFFKNAETLNIMSGAPLDLIAVKEFDKEFEGAYDNLARLKSKIDSYTPSTDKKQELAKIKNIGIHFLIVLCICGIVSLLTNDMRKNPIRLTTIKGKMRFWGAVTIESLIAISALYIGVVKITGGPDLETLNLLNITWSVLIGAVLSGIGVLNLVYTIGTKIHDKILK